MTKKPTSPTPADLPVKGPESRFPKAAVDYIDTLLDVERTRFEKELAAAVTPREEPAWPTLPERLELMAEGDDFAGSGWGKLDHTKKGIGRRWMARIGTLLFAADATRGGIVRLTGTGYLRRRYVDDLTVWLDNMPVEGVAVRKGINGWSFEGHVPALAGRPFHILRLQTSGIRPFDKGPDTHASLALSVVDYKAAEKA
ncbi:MULTISPECIES: hypothetical protein [Kordiimonas]|mgnify:CR=1 FL=1|jgi:hypothetical protein|uniref:hypothetical protein n=1 Tax=Kordiimonas TaxID=288021 RepID=UPI00257D8637|nr:hypothetical protein [Kordiimonas sp. UBA4487]